MDPVAWTVLLSTLGASGNGAQRLSARWPRFGGPTLPALISPTAYCTTLVLPRVHEHESVGRGRKEGRYVRTSPHPRLVKQGGPIPF